MNNRQKSIIICSLFCIGFAQVNTESMREDVDEKLSNSVSFSYNLEQSDIKVEEIGAHYRLNYQPNSKLNSFIVCNYESEMAQESDNNAIIFDKGFIHARATKHLFKKLYGEIFFQNGFNDFLYIDKRILAGSVARFKFENVLSDPVFIGIGIMNEDENYQESAESSKSLIRSTNYIKTSFNIMENISWDNTGYFQFALSDSEDYRIIFDSILALNINEFLSFSLVLNYRFDSLPHSGLGESYYQLGNEITIDF